MRRIKKRGPRPGCSSVKNCTDAGAVFILIAGTRLNLCLRSPAFSPAFFRGRRATISKANQQCPDAAWPVISRITPRPDFWSDGRIVHLLLSWMVQMNSHQQRLATLTHTTAHLHAKLNELNRLRDQVRKARRSAWKSQRTVRRKSVFRTTEAAN